MVEYVSYKELKNYPGCVARFIGGGEKAPYFTSLANGGSLICWKPWKHPRKWNTLGFNALAFYEKNELMYFVED